MASYIIMDRQTRHDGRHGFTRTVLPSQDRPVSRKVVK